MIAIMADSMAHQDLANLAISSVSTCARMRAWLAVTVRHVQSTGLRWTIPLW
jgi:hypothetical protein